jgi:hypothetical protein
MPTLQQYQASLGADDPEAQKTQSPQMRGSNIANAYMANQPKPQNAAGQCPTCGTNTASQEVGGSTPQVTSTASTSDVCPDCGSSTSGGGPADMLGSLAGAI